MAEGRAAGQVLAGAGLLAAAQAAWPPLWLVALPALLPWLGLGAWTDWVVGAADSVLDLPRVATWLLLLNSMALQLHLPRRAPAPTANA